MSGIPGMAMADASDLNADDIMDSAIDTGEDDVGLNPPEVNLQMPAQSAPAPQQQAAPPQRPSLDDIFSAPAERPSLDAIFSDEKKDPSILDKVKQAASDSVAWTPLGVAANYGAKGAAYLADKFDQATLNPIRGAIDSKLDGGSPLEGAIDGLMGNKKLRTADVLEKGIPALSKKIPVPDAESYGEERGGGNPGSTFDMKYVESIPASEVVGLATDALAGNAELKIAGKVLKGIPAFAKLATEATKNVVSALSNASDMNKEASILSDAQKSVIAARGVEQTSAELRNLYGLKITPDALDVTNPAEIQAAKSIKNNKQINDIMIRNGEQTVDAMQKHMEAFANLAPKAGGAEKAFEVVKGAQDAEGQFIGAFRQQAAQAAGNGKLPIPKLQAGLDDLMARAGYTKDGAPHIRTVADNLGIKMDEAEQLMMKVEGLQNRTASGRMEYKQLLNTYERYLGDAVSGAQSGSPPYRKALADLRRSSAEQLMDTTGVVLQDSNPNASAQYKESLKKYSTVKDSYENLSGLLSKDEMTADSFARYITSGDASLDKIQSVNNILKMHDPELIKDLNGAVMKRIFTNNLNTPSASNPMVYDMAGVKKDLMKLTGTDVNKSVLSKLTGDPKMAQDMLKFADLAEAVGNSAKNLQPAIEEGMVGRMLYLGSKVGAPKEMISEMVMMMNRDKNLNRYLDAAGVARLEKFAPKNEQPAFANYLRSVVSLKEQKAEERFNNKLGQNKK